ncbi:hypothetical protein HN51_040506 [Arachis hypogaea]|uniref:wall-associated receptor kinase-like 20 n=1 Tax=Arachis ipaensis TaxID=130454 RepID=UPI0007AEF3AB|nr:wall-associated receptor kinase-like 20 [Arachis ipaensis]XP_025657767.1 wall-associated receptor kinase-like 20 [Arachis hypogaea]
MRPSSNLGYAFLLHTLLFLCHHTCSSQKTCPQCGSMQVPYPLSTQPSCGDPYYKLQCDQQSGKLYFDTLNESSYVILKIMSSIQRMVVQPAPWLSRTSCVTQDMPVSNGLWLNQSLPFNITSSNTIFLFNCSPRLLVSPLNCSASSICHQYLESSGHVRKSQALDCASGIHPCCTFVAGGNPSAYKIRLHNSGCKAFRSILHLDEDKPPNEWEEGLEIQWLPPPEPVCKTQKDCSGDSKCSPGKNGLLRCLCNKGHHWEPYAATCLRHTRNSKLKTSIVISIVVTIFFSLAIVLVVITKCCRIYSYMEENKKKKKEKERENVLKSSTGEKPYRMFHLKEVKKATNCFSQDRILGSGGFGEVYRGELQDGTMVAVKKAKVGNLKSTQQVLNEVAILSQVNHKNLVRLLGCCVEESEQPLMIYEYISNGTLYDHLHGRYQSFLDWETRLKVALQTAEALAYLHSAAHTPIYHRDVKSTNILLDDEFNAKVSDFGLSKLAIPGLSHVSTCAQGTVGYLDPEYYRNYQLTDKSDVYSYGVVLLELLSSQKVIDFNRDPDCVNLAVHVSQHASNGTLLMEVVDRRLVCKGEFRGSIRMFSELALDCLREKKGERPSMKDIVQRLISIFKLIDQERNYNVNVNVLVENEQ